MRFLHGAIVRCSQGVRDIRNNIALKRWQEPQVTHTVPWQAVLQSIPMCRRDSRAACLVQTALTFVMCCCGGGPEAVLSARAAMWS